MGGSGSVWESGREMRWDWEGRKGRGSGKRGLRVIEAVEGEIKRMGKNEC
jgi:hypothetical protein